MRPPLTRLARAWWRPQRRWDRALACLERAGRLTLAEAHALRAGERLADLYAEIAGPDLSADALAEIADLIRAGDLTEAAIALGRLHPALRDLPHLVARSARHGRA